MSDLNSENNQQELEQSSDKFDSSTTPQKNELIAENLLATKPSSPPSQPDKINKKIWLGVGAALFLIIAMASTYLYLERNRVFPGGKTIGEKNLFSGFSKLVIGAANAQDNFTLRPLNSDSLGVNPETIYVIKSKEPLSEDLIKENLSISPEFAYDFKKVTDTEWQIVPQQALAPNTLVRIALVASFIDENNQSQERDYSWVYQVKDSFKVLHSIPRDAGTNVPLNSGIEVTFSHDNYYDYEKYFSLSPLVEGRFEKHGRTLVFVPKEPLSASTLYQVTIKSGLPIADSSDTLASDYIFTFETQSARTVKKSWYGVYNRLIETTSKYPPILQISSYEAPEKLEVEVFLFNGWQDYLSSIRQRDNLPWWSYAKEDFLMDTSKLKRLSSFTALVKKSQQITYIEFPESLNKGFYLAELKNKGDKVQVWIQVSDLSTYYNVTKTETIFWVNDNISKSPVDGVKIELLDNPLAVLTDAKGIAVFKTPEEILNNATNEKVTRRQYFKLTRDDNVLILPASQISHNWWWNRPAAADNYWLYLYTDRPRYQTTDIIKYWGLIKDRGSKPIDEKITLTLFKEGYVDYYYRPVAIMSQDLSLSDLDTFTGEMAIKNLRPDYYTLELKIGETVVKRSYLTIMPYTKPAFQLSITPDRHVAFADEIVNLKVKASFFEGTAVPALALKLQMPEGEHKFITDENGEANLTYTKKYSDCINTYGCWPDYARLSISPENSELGEISAETYIRYYGPKIYFETKTLYPAKGQGQVEITVKLIDLTKLEAEELWSRGMGDTAAADVKIEGDLIKTTYVKQETGTAYDFINKTTYKTYRYDMREEKVRSFTGTTDQNGRYIFKEELLPETSYRLEYKVFDSQGRFERGVNYLYYYDGISLNHYQGFNYRYYYLTLADPVTQQYKTYSINDEVRAYFRKNEEPLPDSSNRFLYLQLQNGLQEYQVASKSEYRFPFEARDVPNVNLVGVYYDGLAYHSTAESYWGESANFKNSDRQLKVKVETNKDKYLPGEDVKLKIKVTNMNDKPMPTEVNLNLVDEAYYAVAEDTAVPLESIYANVGPGTLIALSTHEDLTSPQSSAEKGGCLAAGAEILLADGTTKPIEKMLVGDEVLTFNDPVSRELTSGRVEEVVEHLVGEYMIINEKTKITPEHQVFANNHFIDAGRLKVGDWLWSPNKEKIIIRSIEIKKQLIKVYNLRIEPQHTYIADGFWVHNQEKGGGAREYFTDAAVFQSIRTDNDGQAAVEFKLPDNITSWRVTTQGITADLWAGVSVTKIPVSLPVFAEVTIGNEYLNSDQPQARLRAFGTALSSADMVDFSLSAPTLGLDKSGTLSASAFKSVYFSLPILTLGDHQIVYELKSAKGNDAIKLPLRVISSRLAGQTSRSSQLTPETRVEAINNFPIAVVLNDLGRNELYDPLLNLCWSWGDRLDQKYVRKLSRQILKKYYDEDILEPAFNAFDYQLSNGGLTLLPYSSDDLEFSARVSALGVEDFDQLSLAQYFFNKLENKVANREEVSYSLFGLAELGEPVLIRIDAWLKRTDLSPKEKLYLAQALFDLGAKEWSQTIFYDVLKQYGEEKLPQIAVRVSQNYDEVFQTTAIAAVLAASLDVKEAKGLFTYLIENQVLYGEKANSENLFNLEKLNYLKHVLPNLKPSPAKVTYVLAGETKEVNVTGSSLYFFQLAPEQASSLSFKSIIGQVGISVRYIEPLDLNKVVRDNDISIRREYYVNEKMTTDFKENDLIEVRLYPGFSKEALSGDYQITDILPSGLAPVTKLYYRNYSYDCNLWYPYNTEEQMVKYFINRDWHSDRCTFDYIKYYARVKNRGIYQAEPAIIQSFINPEFINYSDPQSITITE